jgi:hypothetical protein
MENRDDWRGWRAPIIAEFKHLVSHVLFSAIQAVAIGYLFDGPFALCFLV